MTNEAKDTLRIDALLEATQILWPELSAPRKAKLKEQAWLAIRKVNQEIASREMAEAAAASFAVAMGCTA